MTITRTFYSASLLALAAIMGDQLVQGIHITINGIAAGLRNSG